MRRLASFLLLGVALAAGAATEIWRWKDAEGVVHYSDSPVPGAERVPLGSALPAGAAPANLPSVSTPAGTPEPESRATVRYKRCEVTQPANDQLFNAGDGVDASVVVDPPLARGHHVQVYLNGGAYPDWPESATSYTLSGLYRGSYTLSARVLDANDRTLCLGTAINFHVRQPSVLSPARQPAKKK